MNLPPLDLKWDKPCVGICYMQRVRGVRWPEYLCCVILHFLFDSKGKTKEEVFKEQEKRAEKKSCVGLCYLTKVRCQPYSLVNPNVIHFYPHVKIDQKQDQIGLERSGS